MSRFFDWAQDLYDRDIVDCESLAELSCKSCPNDYIFRPNVREALYRLQRVDQDLLIQVVQKKRQDATIARYLNELPIDINRYNYSCYFFMLKLD